MSTFKLLGFTLGGKETPGPILDTVMFAVPTAESADWPRLNAALICFWANKKALCN